MGGGGVPLDWLGCPTVGQGLAGGKFLAFKTPLKQNLLRNLKKEAQWGLDDVFRHIQDVTKKDKVLWIDLTNTNRYYEARDVVGREGFEYLKLKMAGHGTPPSAGDKLIFDKACDKFLETHPSGLIAVHCTHGFNRSGYLIISYLISREKLSPKDAVTEFAKQRPPGIYRHNYLTDLCPSDTSLPLPPSPSWVGLDKKLELQKYNNRPRQTQSISSSNPPLLPLPKRRWDQTQSQTREWNNHNNYSQNAANNWRSNNNYNNNRSNNYNNNANYFYNDFPPPPTNFWPQNPQFQQRRGDWQTNQQWGTLNNQSNNGPSIWNNDPNYRQNYRNFDNKRSRF